MREIKFRAWDKNRNSWIEECDLIIESNGRMWAGDANNPPLVQIESECVVFFTGLKDKNGKEIYEGDLLTDYGEAPPLYVEYSEKHGAYCFVDKFDPSGTVYYTPLMIYYEQMEVIGNIYENPELLEGTV